MKASKDLLPLFRLFLHLPNYYSWCMRILFSFHCILFDNSRGYVFCFFTSFQKICLYLEVVLESFPFSNSAIHIFIRIFDSLQIDFVQVKEYGSNILLFVDFEFSQHYLLNRFSFILVYILMSLSKNRCL